MDPGSRHQQLNKPIPTSPPPESKRDDDDCDMKRKSSSQDDSDEDESGKLSGSDQQQQHPQLPSHPFNQGRGGTPSGQGGGQYPMQPSLQQQQEALFQQEVLYQAQQQQQAAQQQQQQGRGGNATPQYPPAPGDSSLLFGGSAAASSFSGELLRQLANTPGGLSSAMAAAGMGQHQQQQQTPGGDRSWAFNAFGQTPLTSAASFGSSSGAPTPQQQQQGGNILRGSTATSHLGTIHGGGSSGMDRIVDNLGGIQPTPISLRGRGNPQLSTLQSQLATQQAMQQQLQVLQQQEIQREQQRQQQQQQQQQQSQGRGGGSLSMLPSVNEDDPLMQYETRPGSLADQSPMDLSAGVKRRSSTTSSVQGSSADDGRDSSGHGSGMLPILFLMYGTMTFLYHLTVSCFLSFNITTRI